jgi:hypothetical protein
MRSVESTDFCLMMPKVKKACESLFCFSSTFIQSYVTIELLENFAKNQAFVNCLGGFYPPPKTRSPILSGLSLTFLQYFV